MNRVNQCPSRKVADRVSITIEVFDVCKVTAGPRISISRFVEIDVVCENVVFVCARCLNKLGDIWNLLIRCAGDACLSCKRFELCKVAHRIAIVDRFVFRPTFVCPNQYTTLWNRA